MELKPESELQFWRWEESKQFLKIILGIMKILRDGFTRN